MALIDSELLDRYIDRVVEITQTGVTREAVLSDEFVLARKDATQVTYAPIHYLNENAKVVILGITPGWAQAEIIFRTVGEALTQGKSKEDACRAAKYAASFAGAMRSNLVAMLDDLGLSRIFSLESSADLFAGRVELLDTGSVLMYPVFNAGQNYTGHTPKLEPRSWLWQFTDRVQRQLSQYRDALVVPLGKAAESVASRLCDPDSVTVLRGFPHPSGANGHRKTQFASHREAMARTVEEWGQAAC
jgi:hypothetical protein